MSAPTVSPKRVRWAFNIQTWQPTVSQFMLASSCIQKEEKERIGRFVFQEDVKASLVGRLLMRKYVSSACEIPYSEVMFFRDEGKPYVVNSQVAFNVSHHGDLVVLAGEEASRKVGVDVMKFEYKTGIELDDFFNVMSRQFSAREWGKIRGLVGSTSKKQCEMFYRHWCLKESYLKAIGTGLLVDMNRVGMLIKEPELHVGTVVTDTEVCFDGELLKTWRFEETLVNEDHCVAVAINKDSNEVDFGNSECSFQFLDFDVLMEGSRYVLPPDLAYTLNFFNKTEKNLALP